MISEVLPISEDISSLIAKGASKEDIIKQAYKDGFVDMFANGMQKAIDGITTIDEILRVAKT
jgi:general secretion pathway protein E